VTAATKVTGLPKTEAFGKLVSAMLLGALAAIRKAGTEKSSGTASLTASTACTS
jgi:hypothetical protein